MPDIPPIRQSTNIQQPIIPDVTKTWKVGQILNGTTQKGGNALSNVIIKIGQQTIQAKTPIPLKDGEEVKLLVKTAFENTTDIKMTKLPILSILNDNHSVLDKNTIAAIKLRQFISIQQSFNQLQQLSNTLLNRSNKLSELPKSLSSSLNAIQNNLMTMPENISAAQIKQQLLNSGIFYESKLVQNIKYENTNNNLSTDFKNQLLTAKSVLTKMLPNEFSKDNKQLFIKNLAQIQKIFFQENTPLRNIEFTSTTIKALNLLSKPLLIQLENNLAGKIKDDIPDELVTFKKILSMNTPQSTPQLQEHINTRLMLFELSQQIDQAISKITSLQLQPISRDGDNMVLLFFNMIFKDNNDRFDINYRIQQDNKKDDTDNQSWSVILNFDFKSLGKIQSKIILQGKNLSNIFNTENPITAKKIESLLPLLEKNLIKANLNISHLSVLNTLKSNNPITQSLINLLDENA